MVQSELALGREGDMDRIPAHWLLAQMGKSVLRPGGVELTEAMLTALEIRPADDVVEFAPGLGITAQLTLKRQPASYIAVERDDAAARRVAGLLKGPNQRCVTGTAQATGLPTACFSVVYGEAMLTMQSQAIKDQIVREAVRLLRPGGRYGIHELALVPDSIDDSKQAEISRAFGQTIHHMVCPLSAAGWKQLLEQHGLKIQASRTAPMHLLEPRRVIRDEGFLGAVRFAFNVLTHGQARSRVLNLRKLFRTYRDNVGALVLVATKPEGGL